jgi:hypothetical protein
MLDPAGLGKVLGKFLLGNGRDGTIGTEHDGAGGSGALVDASQEPSLVRRHCGDVRQFLWADAATDNRRDFGSEQPDHRRQLPTLPPVIDLHCERVPRRHAPEQPKNCTNDSLSLELLTERFGHY